MRIRNAAINGSGPFLPLAGGTMSGNITLPNGLVSSTPLIFNSNSGFYWDSTNNCIGCVNNGIEVGQITTTGYTARRTGATGANLLVISEGAGTLGVQRFSANGNGSISSVMKGRGTIAAPTVILTNDSFGSFQFQGYSGAAFVAGATIAGSCIDTTPSATAMGGRVTFNACAIGAVTQTEVLRYDTASGLSMYGANPVIDANRLIIMRSFIVSTLPAAPASGASAYVTDATAPAWNVALIGAGAIRCKATYNGTAWVAG